MAVRTTQLSGPAVRVFEARVSRGRTWNVRDSVALSSKRTLAGAVLAAAVAMASAASPHVPFAAALTIVALIPAALVDIIDRRLPDRLIAQAGIAGAIGLLIDTTFFERINFVSLGIGAAIGAAVMATPLLAMHLASPASMGFGDVKLAIALGAALGLVTATLPLAALSIGCACSALVGTLRRQRSIAFGPGLVIGAIAALVIVASPITTFDPALDSDDIHSAIIREGTR